MDQTGRILAHRPYVDTPELEVRGKENELQSVKSSSRIQTTNTNKSQMVQK